MANPSGFFGIGEGSTYQLGQFKLAFKSVPGTVQGDYSVCESSSTPPGSGMGLHRHAFDEWHFIIEGRYECQLGEEVRTLAPGEMMFAPGGTPHQLTNLGPGVGRVLAITSPAGVLEAFVAEVVNAQVDSNNPSRQGAPALKDIAARHGIELINAD